VQAYGPQFAKIYNLQWGGFARQVAPHLQEVYEATPLGKQEKTLLDVCCGTGQLALHFLEQGYRVTGIDLSEAMLQYAQENASEWVRKGQARFIQGDAAKFSVGEPVGLAVSTFDALNHLESLAALQSCFRSVYAALLPGGTFILDLNTRQGLQGRWNNIVVEDTEELLVITRGIYLQESNRAYTRISGFFRLENGLYERFEETAFNTAFDLQAVRAALLETGFAQAYFARQQDLMAAIEDPESEGRVFVITKKESANQRQFSLIFI
jgi:SAM-dependent methyltransferase